MDLEQTESHPKRLTGEHGEFTVDESGIYFHFPHSDDEEPKPPLWIGSPLHITARTRDDIVGVLHYRDLLKTDLRSLSGSEEIAKLLRRPVMVPEKRLVTDLFNTFSERKLSIALVVDEFGSVIGLITMENILRSIFGDVGGMHQNSEAAEADGIVEEQESGVYLIDAAMSVSAFNRTMESKLDPMGSSILSGLLLNLYGELPDEGAHVVYGGWRFDIEKVAGNRITLVKAFQVEMEEEPDEAEEPEELEMPVHHH
ncbi:MAG: CBS domain-containing protein [Magnetococcales bacterium]|nr:CBS domain-containing protein [Magnetococcales bacterium]